MLGRKSRFAAPRGPHRNRWSLRAAKSRFSKLAQAALESGPQRVSIRGQDRVVVLRVEDFEQLTQQRTGAALVEAMKACVGDDLDFDFRGERSPVREAEG